VNAEQILSVAKRCAMLFAVAVLSGISDETRAHCDSLGGPVVQDARLALESGDPTPVLKWVRQAREDEIRAAFKQAIAVRALGDDAKALADRHFFETVVRLHRSGEGASYTGLKPAGTPHPAIAAADRAIAQHSLGALDAQLVPALQAGLREHFEHVMRTSNWPRGDVAAGREFVAAYVEFMHYVERLHEAIAGAVHGHFPEGISRQP
jgi:hypothetical protein